MGKEARKSLGSRGADASGHEPRDGKTPRTARGRRSLRLLLDAAAQEFAEKGFHEASISQITARAGMAIGSFYTYFDSKEQIFTALVRDMSGQVRDYVGPRLAGVRGGIAVERAGQAAYLGFVREHKEIYRIIDEAEFVDPASYRDHYAQTAERIARRLDQAAARGEISPGSSEVRAWALMGINVFLGLRFGVWGEEMPIEDVVAVSGDLVENGLAPRNGG
jgi:AcrR family transcriptional regulator